MTSANPALQNLFYEMVRDYEERHGAELNGRLVDVFGLEDGNLIDRLRDGRVVPKDPDVVSRLAHKLEADSSLVAAALKLMSWDGRNRRLGPEDGIILNERLMTRMQNMERYIRKIGKLDDFRDWVKAGAKD